MVGSLVRHPVLAWEGLRVAFALAPTGWWRRWPFLPLPDPAHLRWRIETAYGSPDARPAADDVLDYLEWRRRLRRAR